MIAALLRSLSLALIFTAPAQAEDAESFYLATRKLTIGSPSSAGGGYDSYARLLARHLPKHMPGAPLIVVQNFPAAGGMSLANMVFNTAAKDGSFIGMVRGAVIEEQLLGNAAALFDARRYAWIGNMDSDFDTCLVWAGRGIDSLKDLYLREVIVGSSGAGANSTLLPTLYNDLLGMKLKIVTGYPGTPARVVAMERGELHGACGISTSTIRSTLEQPWRQGKLRVLLQAGIGKDADFPEVPNILEEATSPEVRQALLFLSEGLELGRPLAAAPETPPERVALLRRAFAAAMRDPELVEEARRLQLDIHWHEGGATEATARRLYDTPRAALDRLQAAYKAR